MSKIHVIVPARMESKRFPGKLLANLYGTTVLEHTLESIRNAGYLPHVLTDSQEINAHFHNGTWLHEWYAANGTERVAHFFQSQYADDFWDSEATPLHANPIICLVQGDEVGITEKAIDGAICQVLACSDVGTVSCPIVSQAEYDNSDIVKVAVNHRDPSALWFGRKLGPAGDDKRYIQRHVGVYAFRLDTLLKYPELSVTRAELGESLEQLRWLCNWFTVGVSQLPAPQPHSINSPADIPAINVDGPVAEAERLGSLTRDELVAEGMHAEAGV